MMITTRTAARRIVRTAVLAIALGGLVISAQEHPASQPVTNQALLDGLKDPGKWLMFSGDYTGQRHSPLKQLTPQNVAGLVPQWVFQTTIPGQPGRGIEGTPLVADGVVYLTGNNNEAFALDARTGQRIWRYRHELPAGNSASVCCGPVNRGFAMLGNRLYMNTLDAHVVALDRATGKVIFNVAVEHDPPTGFAMTAAPTIVKNKVIVSVAGGDFATRGFIDAYDTETGQRAWRFYVVPGKGEPGSETWPADWEAASRGGGNPWNAASYDPATNLVFIGTGNPNPDYYRGDREGDNLYTCSLVALDADTGKLKWYYQFTPSDVHDWDASQVPVLADVLMGGQVRKVVMVANRNSFFYVLDRETGKLLLGKPFLDNQNWAKEIGKDGKPIVLNEWGTPENCLPEGHGGTNYQPPSYDPERRLFFVTAHETCVTYTGTKPTTIKLGAPLSGGVRRNVPGVDQYPVLRAIDPATGERKWQHKYRTYPSTVSLDLTGGIMSTATGLVFTGDNDGYLQAFDATNGKLLWRFNTGGPVWGSAPITFMLDGRQWVMTTSGLNLTAFALPDMTRAK